MNQSLNRVELVGYVGSCKALQINGEKLGCTFTLCTTMASLDANGNPVITTTWHNIRAFSSIRISLSDIATAAKPDMKCPVHVIGHIRQEKFTDAEGDERSCYTIVAREVYVYKPGGLFAEQQ